MFTGIIDHKGKLLSKVPSKQGLNLTFESRFSDLMLGESIAVDGACLTVTACSEGKFSVDVSPETLRLTTLGELKAGGFVNLERALRLEDRLGGHWVTGHVDETLKVSAITPASDFVVMEFTGISPAYKAYVTKKGSIALSGVSLTVNEVLDSGFQIMVIPHTLERTTLSSLQASDRINVEYDWMTKIVVEQVRALWKERAAHE